MATAVLDIAADDGIRTFQKCLIGCTRRRETYRHNLFPVAKTQGECKTEPSCLERLAELKAARMSLALGRQVKSVLSGSKQVTFNQSFGDQKQCIEDLIYEHECECGKYRKKKPQQCAPLCPPELGCGCGPRRGCGAGCYVNSRRGYL